MVIRTMLVEMEGKKEIEISSLKSIYNSTAKLDLCRLL